ncbi:cytochrome P450 [Coniochaeta ligniaria NRRL 30616]|uniref:Cytochrome P450 n=1 Tax=Coniochaeta ligniaria NRRL 30616 TaxID=1408157 RepID=A0A1J7ITU0_9PEZI|nr:cytochrome P450 [Coniochaeta ligniaria NRRL 30616]
MALVPLLLAAILAVVAKYALKDTITSSATTVFVASFVSLYIAHKLYQLFVYPRYFSPLRHIPGPKDHHFLLGQAVNQFKANSPNEPYVSWVKKWPNEDFIRYLTFGNSEALLVTSLAAHREILQAKCYSFVKPPFFKRLITDIVGYGIVFSEGDDHKSQRKAFRGMFSLGNLKSFLPVFRSKGEELSGLFDRAIAKDDGIVELVEVYSRLTLDIIGIFGLGVDLDNLSNKHSVFHECYHEIFDPTPAGLVLTAINAFVPIRWLPVKPNRDFIRANGIIHSMLGDIIKQRVADVRTARGQPKPDKKASEEENSKDLLTFMVEEKYFAEDGDSWSEEDMLNQILNVVAGGHETTASSFVWATHVLSTYPDVERRLLAEIRQLLKRSPRPDYAEIEGLRYLNNFMRELLRVHCPAISAPREAGEDVVIRGVLIPKGTTVHTMPAAVQHNPSIWGPNTEVFDPDRWDNLSGEAADTYAFAAFSQGPRICIGRVFTMIEFKAIMVEIVSKFRFEKVGKGDIELINPSVLLRPRGGLKVKVIRRE